MKGCSPAITRADELRYWAFQEIGCICCVREGYAGVPAQAHHITQDSNQNTLPVCPWHHMGQTPSGMSIDIATALYGPSLAVSRRQFELRYGTEQELLADVDERVALQLQRRVA